MSAREPIAQEAYNSMAEAYAARVDTKPHNAYYERPATLSLLPDIRGKRVLDAGCGPGVYAEWLAESGAEVVAFEANDKMVELARQRLVDRAQVVQASLEHSLDFLADGSFDVVLSALAMDYVEDWGAAFGEFYRHRPRPPARATAGYLAGDLPAGERGLGGDCSESRKGTWGERVWILSKK